MKLTDGKVYSVFDELLGEPKDLQATEEGLSVNLPSGEIVFVHKDRFSADDWEVYNAVKQYWEENTSEVDIEALKKAKIFELDKACNEAILNGFFSSCKGEQKFYGFNYEDQQNMVGIVTLINSGTDKPIYWKEKGGFPEEYSQAEFLLLYNDAFDAKNNKWIQFHVLKSYTEQAQTKEEIEAIQW
jgi:hypothetical protein